MSFDPEALDLTVARLVAPKELFCQVGRFVNSLEDPIFRSKVVLYLESDHQHKTLMEAFLETTGVEFNNSAMSRHRRQICPCNDRVRK